MADTKPNPYIVKWNLFTCYLNSPPFGRAISYNNCNPGGPVGLPQGCKPIHWNPNTFLEKKVCWQIAQKLQKTSVANFTYLFWTLYFASRTKNKLKQLYFHGAVSMFFQQSLHLPKTNNQNGGCYDHMTHEISLAGSHSLHRRIADVCFELHFRVTPGQFRSVAASSLHRRLALLATSTRPSFSKNAYLGILFAPMYQKYSLDFVSFVVLFQYSNRKTPWSV